MAMQSLSHNWPMEIRDLLFNSSKLKDSLAFFDIFSESDNVDLNLGFMIWPFVTATSDLSVGCRSSQMCISLLSK